MSETIDVEALARAIAGRMAPDALLDADDVGAVLKCSARYVRESLNGTPGFPRAIRLPTNDGSRSHPRWVRADIIEWVERHRAGRTPGRGGARRLLTD